MRRPVRMVPHGRRKQVVLRLPPNSGYDPTEKLLSPGHGIKLLGGGSHGDGDAFCDPEGGSSPAVGKEPIQVDRVTGRPGRIGRQVEEVNVKLEGADRNGEGNASEGGQSPVQSEGRRQQQRQQQQQQAAADMINSRERLALLLRPPSLQRLPSGESSYSGSLFSGATCDGNVFSGTTATSNDDANTSLVVAAGQKEDGSQRNWAHKAQESYYLQLALVTRLASHAFLADDAYFLQGSAREICGVSSDVQAVSYRLWVNGCLSFSDKIFDGFYNILGMDPYLWAMCNESEEGRRLPSLTALKAVDPRDSSMEVVLVDKQNDSRLKELEERAMELSYKLGLTMDLVKKLAKLVSLCMGGFFAMEQGELYRRWKLCSKTLRKSQQCIVILIGSLSVGLCRHRAILFKELADYVGLPCRIARGCKYCASAHPSSCLVKLEDSKHSLREYVVDLVGEPGNIHNPDSSINGHLFSSLPSPFQVHQLLDGEKSYSSNGPWSFSPSSEHAGTRLGGKEPCLPASSVKFLKDLNTMG